jgi:hypothetical protein
MHIFDFRWDDKTSKPYFQIIKNNNIENKFLEYDKELSISVIDNSFECVGNIQNKKYSPCLTSEKETKKCDKCKKLEDYFPCQYCNGFNCNKFRNDKIQNCDDEHMVYLALFSKDIVKVGVSKLSRMKARQIEQGSHFTIIFAKGMSGVMARRLEYNIGKLGFPDKIPANKKKEIIIPKIDLEEGKQILNQKYNLAKNYIIDSMPEMLKYIVDDEFWDLRELYSKNFENLEKSNKPIQFLSLEKGDSINGVLRGTKGSFLIIETEREIVLILAKKFIGKKNIF